MSGYPSYRDVDAGWITRIPAHWSALPVKYVCTYNDEVLLESADPGTVIQYVEISDVDQANGLKGSVTVTLRDAPSRARRQVRDGDVIVSTVRTYLRSVAPINNPPENLIVSTGFAVIRPDGLAPGFARYALVADGFVGSVVARSTGVSYPAINASDLVRIPVPVPPVEEQKAIAVYLDAETTRIDDLIGAKTQLAQLIDESRWSTLSQILGGLNHETGHAPTSSRFWTVRPSDWSELRVKFLVDRIEQGWSPQAESGAASPEEWGVLKAGACNGGIFKEEENKTLPSEIAPDISLEIKPLDVLMSRGSGSVDLVGSVALVPANVRPRLMLCDLMYRLTLNESLALPDWFVLVMNATQVRRQIRASLRGAEGLTRKISIGEINELVVLVPTLAEQQLLVDQCRVINERASNAIEHVTKEIELLQELRSTTITDAVLGRIDVRDHMKN